jgi:hypothetical protein
MRPLAFAAIPVVVLAALVVSRTPSLGECESPAEKQAASATATMAESPIACNRLALTPEQRKRHFDELGPAVREKITSVRELADGFELEFPTDMATFELVAEWLSGERVCCPFLDIELRSQREGGPLRLALTGRQGVKEFLQAEGAGWIKR